MVVLVILIFLVYHTMSFITLKSIESRLETQEVIQTDTLKEVMGGR